MACKKMCDTCPFKKGTPYHHRRDDWLAELDEESKTAIHGCHNVIDDSDVKDPESQCVGHRKLIEKRQKAAK